MNVYQVVDQLTNLASLSLQFGKVDRLTKHPDGTLETDSTHTVMLGLVCLYLNDSLGLDLDSGMLAKLSLVHDLHESICGDTPTLNQIPDQLKAKDDSEELAKDQIKDLPCIGGIALVYHRQKSREARFVRAVDKLLPQLTHLLNGCAVLKSEGMNRVGFHDAIMVRQYLSLEEYISDVPEVLYLHRILGKRIEEILDSNV